MFDLFAEFLPHKDGGKARLDMINFVSDNRDRYVIDGHVVLKMHETNLNAWACKMTYWETVQTNSPCMHSVTSQSNTPLQ